MTQLGTVARADFRFARATGVALLCLTLVAGCTRGEEEPDVTGVPDAMVADVATFQLADGLFVQPEAAAADTGVAIITANYAEVLGQVWDIDYARAATGAAAGVRDLVTAHAYLTLATRAAETGDAPAPPDGLAATLVVPPAQGEVGAELGALWTWASARSYALDLWGMQVDDPDVERRLGEIDPRALTEDPYLLERLATIYELLGLEVPADVESQRLEHRDDPLPPPASLRDVLTATTVIEAGGGDPTQLAAVGQQAADVLETSAGLDDFSRSRLIALLHATGDVDRVTSELSAVTARLSPDTGLVRSGGSPSLDATYLVARLLDERFSEIANDATLDALAASAADEWEPLIVRLRAAAALRLADDPRWEAQTPLARDAATAQPDVVSVAELPEYLDVMDAAVRIDPDIPKSALTEFDPGADADLQRSAAVALEMSYLFSNPEEIGTMFSDLQSTMTGWLTSPDTTLTQTLTAAGALSASRLVSVDSATFDSIGARVAEARGCDGATTLLAVDGADGGTCSLVLTLQARVVPWSGA